MDDLNRLFKLAGNNGQSEDWNTHFDPSGLILNIPPKNEGYWCTPTNSLTFARRGGDGTHFGLLATRSSLQAEQPVVMTVPMSDSPNVIVGASLREFLALGCKFGYFGLEGLVHQPDETLRQLISCQYDEEEPEENMQLLQSIQTEFELSPWCNPRTRLAELRLRYFAEVQLPVRDPS